MRPLLLVTTTFFPHAGVGSVRASNWARMMPGLGWKPTIACRWYGGTATRALLDEHVSPACDVVYLDGPWAGLTQAQRDEAAQRRGDRGVEIKHNGAVPRGALVTLAKRAVGRSAMARVAFVPDAAVAFWRSRVGRIGRVGQECGAEALVTSSPPHSVHVVGLDPRRAAIPWLADFRDPMVMDSRYGPFGAAAVRTRAYRAFEAACLEAADAVTLLNAMHARWMHRRFPLQRDRLRLLEPMCPEDLVAGRVVGEPTGGGRLGVRVVGSVGNEEAVRLALAVRSLVDREASPLDIELRFVGIPPATRDQIESTLADRVVFTGNLRHDEAKRQIVGADLLVTSLSPHRARSHGTSTKLYEFVAARRPVVHINPMAPDRHAMRGLVRAGALRILDRPADGELREALAAG
ncbi:MAG: glycosyltransferase, partial [Phycisphaerales bacterium]|nr:glycosyltransferase [Phycisphaerales bacterium]